MKYLFVLLALLPSLASAQNTSPPPPDTQPKPHSCGLSWYPPLALKRHREGTTTLSFSITVSGDVEDISVADSSGDVELDRAAKRCASYWKYLPARRNGIPVSVPWKADVVWQIPVASPVLELIRDCPPGDPAPLPHAAATGAVILTFNVEPDGSVRNVTVNTSSGDKELDSVAVACLQARMYKLPIVNGKPSELSATTALTWSAAGAQSSNSASVISPAVETPSH